MRLLHRKILLLFGIFIYCLFILYNIFLHEQLEYVNATSQGVVLVIYEDREETLCKIDDTPPDTKWLEGDVETDEGIIQVQLTECVVPNFINVDIERRLSFNDNCPNPAGWSNSDVLEDIKQLESNVDIR